MKQQLIKGAMIFATALMISQAKAAVIYDSGALSFESSGQSMWDTGNAFRKGDSVFVGTQWHNRTASIGGIAGSANTVVIPGVDAQYIKIYEPRIWVPTPSWSDPFDGYHTGCGCDRNVQISPAIPDVTADTRTGTELNVHSSGKVGLEFGYSIDSGSVDSQAVFQAMAELPDIVLASEFININTSSIFDSGTISTQSPTVDAYISAIMELSGSIDAQICGLGFGCASSGSVALPDIDMNQRVLSVDPNSLKILDGVMPDGSAFAEVPLLNQSLSLEGAAGPLPPYVGFKLSGPGGFTVSSLPPSPAISVDLAELTVFAPDIATTGTGAGSTVTSSGRDDLLSAQLDLDGAAVLLSGLPPVGMNLDLIDTGPFTLQASLDLIDVDAGPVLGVTQDFEFKPTLMANLEFSNPVQIANMPGFHTSWSGLWSELPSFALTGTTTFTPTFWLDALFTNTLGLDLGLVGTLDLLKLGATASIGGVDLLNFNPFSLNNMLGIGNTLFETPKLDFSVYENTFGLGGFNVLAGTPFTLTIVPEPGALGLLLAGALALLSRRRSRVIIREQQSLRA